MPTASSPRTAGPSSLTSAPCNSARTPALKTCRKTRGKSWRKRRAGGVSPPVGARMTKERTRGLTPPARLRRLSCSGGRRGDEALGRVAGFFLQDPRSGTGGRLRRGGALRGRLLSATRAIFSGLSVRVCVLAGPDAWLDGRRDDPRVDWRRLGLGHPPHQRGRHEHAAADGAAVRARAVRRP